MDEIKQIAVVTIGYLPNIGYDRLWVKAIWHTEAENTIDPRTRKPMITIIWYHWKAEHLLSWTAALQEVKKMAKLHNLQLTGKKGWYKKSNETV